MRGCYRSDNIRNGWKADAEQTGHEARFSARFVPNLDSSERLQRDVVDGVARASVWSGSGSLASGSDRFFVRLEHCFAKEWWWSAVGDVWPEGFIVPPPKRDPKERLAYCLETAIPIPDSGSFDDLLRAIDEAEQDSPTG